MTTASEVAGALGGKANGSGWTARCPCHMDDSPSLKIDAGSDGRILLKCFAGCSQKRLVDWAQDQGFDVSGKQRTPADRVVAEYDYRDPAGNVRYQVVRKAPKAFVQRRPDGKGGWVWNMDGVGALPYRLPELLAEPDEPVWIPEGEKDADRLANEGLVASCNSAGAGKWRSERCRWFKDRDVVILPDNDEPGRNHAEDVARKLRDFARRVRIVELPDLPPKGDVSDWLDAGNTFRELRRLAHETLVWEPPAVDSEPRIGESEPREGEAGIALDKADDALPTIRLVAGERPRIVEEAMVALVATEVPLYRRGLSIVNVAVIPAKASDGTNIITPAIVVVPPAQLTHELGKAALWQKFDGRGKKWVTTDVPSDIAGKIAAIPNEWRFRPLAGIVGTQTMRPDGTILDKPGHDPATGYVLFDPPAMPAMPSEPTKRDAERALRTLNRIVDEFPFAFDAARHSHANNPSRSVSLSMLMTPVLRPALMPAVPLLVVQKPSGGSGGSYLCDMVSALATGERCPVLSKAPNVEETEKRLIGAALDGQPIVSIDNCNGELRSEFLCQAVERPLLKVRALGSSEMLRIANSVSYFANGNNIQIAADLVRRTLQCRLDANMERPETREFRRDPLADILADRGRFVAAVLTIARAYVVAGMPDRPAPFMSFGRWSDLVRGALIWLGCADPVDTMADLAVADPVRSERAEVFQAIADAMVDPDYTVPEIVAAARKSSELENALRMIASVDGEISPRRLGKWLAACQNAITGGYKLMRTGTVQNRARWRLVRASR